MTDAVRPARPADVEEICRALPEVEYGVSWGDRPTFKVRGKGFVRYRDKQSDAVDPVTGELYDDVIVVETGDADTKDALVADPGTPWFTTDHFARSRAVLVRESRLGELSRGELAEVITSAWASKAPKTLVRGLLGDG